jgi:hypothetical protein
MKLGMQSCGDDRPFELSSLAFTSSAVVRHSADGPNAPDVTKVSA